MVNKNRYSLNNPKIHCKSENDTVYPFIYGLTCSLNNKFEGSNALGFPFDKMGAIPLFINFIGYKP